MCLFNFQALKTAKEILSDADQVKKLKLLLEEASALLEINVGLFTTYFYEYFLFYFIFILFTR